MEKIKDVFFAIVGVISICFFISLFIPQLREVFLMLGNFFWTLFKSQILDKVIKSVVFYIVIAVLLLGVGVGISAKTEKKIWAFIAILLDAGVVLMAFLYYK